MVWKTLYKSLALAHFYTSYLHVRGAMNYEVCLQDLVRLYDFHYYCAYQRNQEFEYINKKYTDCQRGVNKFHESYCDGQN